MNSVKNSVKLSVLSLKSKWLLRPRNVKSRHLTQPTINSCVLWTNWKNALIQTHCEMDWQPNPKQSWHWLWGLQEQCLLKIKKKWKKHTYIYILIFFFFMDQSERRFIFNFIGQDFCLQIHICTHKHAHTYWERIWKSVCPKEC